MNPKYSFSPIESSGKAIDLGTDLYTDDEKLQLEMASMLIRENFPSIKPFLAYRSYADESKFPNSYHFIDENETSLLRRVYAVQFLENTNTEAAHVEIYWSYFLEMFDQKRNATYQISIPRPAERYAGLEEIHAEIREECPNLSGTVGEKVELIRPSASNIDWKNKYAPKSCLPSHVAYLRIKLNGTWLEPLQAGNKSYLVPWVEFLSAYGSEEPWAVQWLFELNYAEKKRLVVDAIRLPKCIPFSRLSMVGVGPLEDILNEETLGELEKLERETTDPEIRKRFAEVICGIYVHGDPMPIRLRWIALVKRVASEVQIAGLKSYFDDLIKNDTKK